MQTMLLYENTSKLGNENTMQKLVDAIRKSKRVYVVGNGGSAANAIHLINDLLACGIKAYTLDIATLTAFANDHGYYHAFRKWIEVVGEAGDLLIALSGSGKSPNVLEACEAAEIIGMKVHREFGADQGFDMQASEERQIWLGHELMRGFRDRL